MGTRALLSLILAALACAHPPRVTGQEPAAQPEPARWSRYTYPGEEFSAELPSAPKVYHTTRVIRYAPYDSDDVRVFGVYDRGVVYMIVALDRPRPAESDDRLAGYVWGGRGLTPKGEVRAGGAPGREYEVGLGFRGKARLFRTKGHAYLLKAFSDVAGHEEAVERFLNSFVPGANTSGELIADEAPAPPYKAPKAPPAPGPEEGGKGAGRGGDAGGSAAPGVGEEVLKLARGRGGDAAGDGPYRHKEVSRKAVLVYKPEPGFTEEARKHNVTGFVRLSAVLSSTGKVLNVSVLKSLPRGLTDKAIKAARHMLFFPAVKDGREVSQHVVLEYHFNIY